MAKIIIEAIKHTDKVSKSGKPFVSCAVLTKDTNGNSVWIGGFGNATTKSWVKGQTVELEVTKNGEYYNFADVPERNVFVELDQIKATLDQIYQLLVTKTEDKELAKAIDSMRPATNADMNAPIPTHPDEVRIDPEAIPF